jgi:hypothetical protein
MAEETGVQSLETNLFQLTAQRGARWSGDKRCPQFPPCLPSLEEHRDQFKNILCHFSH